jgi:hypothetical protein
METDIYDNTKLRDVGKEDVLTFIQTKIKDKNNFIEILDEIPPLEDKVTMEDGTREDVSSKGFYYERLWDLCIKFGVTDLTLPSIIDKKNIHLQTSHIFDNPNKTEINFQPNCWAGNQLNKNPGGYLRERVRSGNSGGYSDITFLNKFMKEGNEDLYFISVKYFKEEKDIGKYDIPKLCSLIRKHERENRNIKLYIFVKNKESAIKKFKAQNTSSNILIKYINPGGKYENVYDSNDLQRFYFNLKKLLEEYDYLKSEENIRDFETKYLEVLKKIFIPRFHQELFILKINKLIEDGEKNILVGAIPRSGKSYIMAGTILEYIKRNQGKKLKFLMMTPAPNETKGEYQDIFNNHIEFQQLGIDVITYEGKITAKEVCNKKDKHCVIIISKQKLGWSAGSAGEKLLEIDEVRPDETEVVDEVEIEDKYEDENEDKDDKEIKTINDRITKLFGGNPDINVMFLDEAHFGMSTDKAKKIVDVLNSAIANTVKIYVTATYNKPLQAYGVESNCKMTWDMNDIKIMQNLTKETINDNPIKTQFGADVYDETLEFFGDRSGQTLVDKLKSEYAVYPKPYLITSVWDKDFVKVEKLKIGDSEFGWDMNKLFATIGDSDQFANGPELKEMMRYYFGYPHKTKNYEEQSFYRTRGILPRIRSICLNKCRTLQQNHKTTQLWFLPLGSGKIENKVKALINLLTSNEFKDIKREFHFFVAVEIKDRKGQTIDGVTYMNKPREIKKDIEDVETKINNGEIKTDNLIILTGQRLQLGISLRNVDIVTLWNSISSSDAIFQMLFRSMTEVYGPQCDENNNQYCEQKRFGFMVDMNPQRALTNVSLFSANIAKKPDDDDDIQKYRQITDLISIDEDVLYDKFGDEPTQKEKDEFVSELFNKLYTSWNINVKNMKKIISKFSFDMEKLEALKGALKKIQFDNQKVDSKIQAPEEDQQIPAGKTKQKLTKKEKAKKEDGNEDDIEIDLTENATEIISEFISLLNIFTLYLDTGAKCILTDSSRENSQITVFDDIDKLKGAVYKNQKELFLKILNGRLTGNPNNVYPEKVVDSILDALNSSDDKQVMNKIIMSQKKQYYTYTINEPGKLLDFINSELKPKDEERRKNGEVFTPLWLVNEMLDKLDDAYKKEHGKSIFTERDFKWLDPAVGIGNYPIIVYQRLMENLLIKDEEERRKHILEKMLYMVEISDKSIYILNKIFCGDIYNLNIHKGSFLDGKCKYNFMFDVVMGNPPYNPPKTETGSSGNSIWPQFVIKSFYLVKEKGFLLFIHPPGWKKPADELFDPQKLDILGGEYYKYEKKTGKQTIKQIRQGQVWQVLKENGIFSFIYTNDQKNKKIKEYIPYFPAVDYYVYQKNGNKTTCNTKNIFLGEIKDAVEVRLNYKLNYLPNLITNQTQNILDKITTKEGKRKIFNRGIDERNIIWDGKTIDWVYDANKKGFQYKKHGINASSETGKPKEDTVGINKIIINFGGGIDAYNVKYISKNDEIGVLDKTMYTKVDSDSEGKYIQNFFNSDIVKFIFLITQYASGKTTQNEPIVANSITIPPEGVEDYYEFFDIKKDQKYIEDILTHYYKGSKNITVQDEPEEIENDEENDEENDQENDEEVKPKKTTKKLDKKLVLIPATEANEDIPIPIPSPISKKKRTIKKRPIDPTAEKIFNPLTNRHVKNTNANRKKIEKQTLKRGGKSKKRTRRRRN